MDGQKSKVPHRAAKNKLFLIWNLDGDCWFEDSFLFEYGKYAKYKNLIFTLSNNHSKEFVLSLYSNEKRGLILNIK